MPTFFAILPVLLSLLPLLLSAAPPDTLLLGSSLSVEKNQTDVLRSPDGTFTCGFYSIYTNAFTFSIWYTNSANKTVVWTANRVRPVHARGAVLMSCGDFSSMDGATRRQWRLVVQIWFSWFS
ncbi:unnamed protein product [Urochloa humidicola]